MSGYLRETGRSIVTEEPGSEAPGRNATSYIHNLLELHDQYTVFLERSFNSDKLFKNAIQSVSVGLGQHFDWELKCMFCTLGDA